MTIAQMFSRSDRPIDVICVGRVAVDLYAEQIGSPLSQAQSFRKYLGGCAGNIAVGTSRLGLASAMCSRVGADAMGEFLRAQLVHEGVNTSMLITDESHLTGLVLLGVNPPDDFPLIFYRNDCADEQLQLDDMSQTLLRKSKCVVVTGTSLAKPNMRATVQGIIGLAKKCETPVVLDIDYRPVLWGLTKPGEGALRYQKSREVSEVFASVLPHVDLVVGTEEEFLIASGRNTAQEAVEHFRTNYRAMLVVKKGEHGCEVWAPELNSPVSPAPFKVEVLNVLGAGDAFMSGFLRGLLRGEPLETCARYANACGALVVSRHGCAPAMPSMDELDYFMADHEALDAKRIQMLHRRAHMGAPSSKDLFVLAFDHRTQFEFPALENPPTPFSKGGNLISEFKSQVFKGFCAANEKLAVADTAILVDPVYGTQVLRVSGANMTGVPIEAASAEQLELQWLTEKSVYEELLYRPANQFVKVLVRFHPGMPAPIAAHQLAKLRELSHACDALERKLMLELLIPPGMNDDGKAHADAMRVIYERDIAPWWWKIQAMPQLRDWNEVCAVIDAFDANARIVILGKGASVAELADGFKIAKSTHHACGFAVGRTIFWPSWQRVLAGEMPMSEVASDVAARFKEVANAWLQRHT